MNVFSTRTVLVFVFVCAVAYYSGIFDKGAYVPHPLQHPIPTRSIQYAAPVSVHYDLGQPHVMAVAGFGQVSQPRFASVNPYTGMASARSYQPVWAPFPGVLSRAEIIYLEIFGDDNGWNQYVYYSTIQVVYMNGDYYFIVRSYCGIGIIKFSDGVLSLVNNCDIEFNNISGWGRIQYYSTIRATVAGDSLYISGRGACGMHIYKLVGSKPVLISLCEIEFSDELGWDAERYYSTIQTSAANNNLFIIGRGPCGMYIYQTWEDKVYEVNRCVIEFSDERGWFQPEYYSTIKSVVLYGEIYIYGRYIDGLIIYKTLKGKEIALISEREIGWSDASGWNQEQYYSTIQATAANHSIYITARGPHGMIVYQLVSGSVSLFNDDNHHFTDEDGWCNETYYKTIGAKVVSDELYIYGRGPCGMDYFSFASNGSALPIHNCYAEWSDSAGWNKPEYYRTIHGLLADGLAIWGRYKDGMYLFKV